MTQAEFRADIRALARSTSAEAGTLLPADNVFLDLLINLATELVVVDLVPFLPSFFLDYEDINLIANIQSYTLTKEWLQIWNMAKNVSGEDPSPLEYLPWHDEIIGQYVGETMDYPKNWTLRGNAIVFLPKPAKAVTGYARVHIIKPEAASMATGGPVMVPRVAHRLITLKALEVTATILELGAVKTWERLYIKFFASIQKVLGNLVQGQPRFLGNSFREKRYTDRRDKAFYDLPGEEFFRG